jgi:lysozyme
VIQRLSPNMRKGAAGIVLVGASLVAFVGGHEGERLVVYKDIVGVPTVCDGHTGADVVMGARWTHEECVAIEKKDLASAGTAVLACVHAPLNQNQYDAFTSLAYNIGAHAFCGSTLAKIANTGDVPRACPEILKWDMAGGKHVPGLANRRYDEFALCLRPVGAPAANAPSFKAAA